MCKMKVSHIFSIDDGRTIFGGSMEGCEELTSLKGCWKVLKNSNFTQNINIESENFFHPFHKKGVRVLESFTPLSFDKDSISENVIELIKL